MAAGVKHPLYVLVPHVGSRALREAEDAGDVVVEVCERCWGPYLAGRLDEHLRAIPHRLPPLGAEVG
jgi:hypothetical protein